MGEVNFAFWNCSGIVSSSSLKEKVDFMNSCLSAKLDVIILIETHHKVLSEISALPLTYLSSSHIIQTGVNDGDPYAGIAVLISNRFTLIEHTELVKGRLLNFKVKSQQKVYNITVLYGYTGRNASQTKMSEMVKSLTPMHSRTDNNIILGDFNFVEHDLDRTNRIRSGKNHMDTILAKPWEAFANELDLTDPFRARNPLKRMYSYIHTKDNAKSRIDRIYLNDENCNDLLAYKHIHTTFSKAHKIVTFSLNEHCERGQGYWKMNTSILKDRAHQTLIENIVNDVMALGIDDPIERWLVFKGTVAIDTRAYCIRKRGLEKSIKTFCDNKITQLEQNPLLSQDIKLHKEYEFYTSKINQYNRKQMEGYQTRIKTQPRLEPGEPNISFFADLEKKESKKKNITHLMNSDGEIKHDTESMKNIAIDYYTELFNEKKRTRRRVLSYSKILKNKSVPKKKQI